MKGKNLIPACLVLILSVLLAAGSQTFMAPCVHEDGGIGVCHGAGQMLFGMGILLAALALFALLAREDSSRGALYLAMLPAALVGFLTPGTLIPLCKMSSMRCRAITRPAGMLLCALMFLAALTGLLLNGRKAKKKS